ncbi:MAG TPA: hypothetical protein VHA78_04265 [Candidatus Peribacteraceae bacterium]|nr:hypothetical protein [Candidatus Peribacteraceae bacterium]
MINQFKSAVTKSINEYRNSPGAQIWQRNYHEHIIRDEDERLRIERYILDNPSHWDIDPDNL